MKYFISIAIFMFISSFAGVRAQNDPTLAGMILMYTNKAEKELKNQEKVMLLQSTGHIWTKEEVEATTDLQREFNNYLDSFRSIVSYAAQIYGFYHEIGQLVDNMGGLVAQLDAHPANGLAVALSAKRNKIYRELIMNSIEIVNDIRTVCLSGNKMTEKERVEIVFGIRPKLKKMNKQLKRLTSGEIHHHGRCLDGDRRRGKTHQSEQSRDSSGCQEAVEAGGQERKLMEQREQSRTCSSYAES